MASVVCVGIVAGVVIVAAAAGTAYVACQNEVLICQDEAAPTSPQRIDAGVAPAPPRHTGNHTPAPVNPPSPPMPMPPEPSRDSTIHSTPWEMDETLVCEAFPLPEAEDFKITTFPAPQEGEVPVFMAKDDRRGEKLPMPPEWVRDIDGTPFKTFVESNRQLDALGVDLANQAKAPLASIPYFARFSTGIAVAVVEENGTTIRVAAVAGRGSGSDLIGTIGQVLNLTPFPSGDMHAEEFLWYKYGNRIKAMGVADRNGPCYTTKDNCAQFLRDRNFYDVYWDSTFR